MTSFLAATFSVESGRRIVRRLDAFHPRPLMVLDAAVVDWPGEDVKPSTWQARPLDDRRALSGAFWGHLFARLVLLPLSHVPDLGDLAGPRAAIADDDASLGHLGLSSQLLTALRHAIIPGTVTVLALQHDDQRHEVEEDCERRASFVLRTELSQEEERRLYAGFGGLSTAADGESSQC